MNLSKYVVLLIIVGTPLAGCRDEPTAPTQTPTGLEITAEGFTVLSGGILHLRAVTTLRDGSSEDVTEDVVWSISPGSVGLIEADGRFLAFQGRKGSETITAQYQGQSATAEVMVIPRVQQIDIIPVQPILMTGESVQFKAIANFEDGSQQFVTDEATWSVSPEAMGSISGTGMLQSQSVGDVVVRASHQSDAVNAPVLSDSAEVEIVASEEASLIGLFDMVEIPAGSFTMGNNQGNPNEQPEHEVFVDRFMISRFEITNIQYRRFLHDAQSQNLVTVQDDVVYGTGGRFPGKPYLLLKASQNVGITIFFSSRNSFTNITSQRDKPVAKLTWFGAMAFCDFYGLRLPTEAEWEKASRAGQQLEYGTPNGAINPEIANYDSGSLVDVGSFDPNPFGLYDMAGNAAEFVFDTYDANFYAMSPSDNPFGPGPRDPLTDIIGPVVWRGGSFLTDSLSCRSSYRGSIQRAPDIFSGEDGFGFRVVK